MQSIALCPDDVPRPRVPITLDEQITTVHRALAVLTVMCRARVDQGHMTQTRADYHMATMEAVLGTLQRVQEAQAACLGEVYP